MRTAGGAQRADAEPDEVGRADRLHDGEGRGGGDEDRRHADRRGRAVHDEAGEVAGDRAPRPRPAAGDHLPGEERHVGAGHDRDQDRGGEERQRGAPRAEDSRRTACARPRRRRKVGRASAIHGGTEMSEPATRRAPARTRAERRGEPRDLDVGRRRGDRRAAPLRRRAGARRAPATPSRRVAIYARLVEALGLRVRVDVIAGTSAGGLNGGMLGAAVATGASVRGREELWMEVGDLKSLLRLGDVDKGLPSLLKGEEILYGQLRSRFDAALRTPVAAPEGAAEDSGPARPPDRHRHRHRRRRARRRRTASAGR